MWKAGESYGLTAVIYGGAGGGTVESCDVVIDGGRIELTVTGSLCRGNEHLPLATPLPVSCAIPALPEGTYVINTSTPTTVTLQASSDAGVALDPCF